MNPTGTPTGGGARLPAPAVFLGALASEVNEPDVLDPSFAAIADITERVVTAVRTGTVPEVDAAQKLRSLRLTDAAGHQWAVGATSLRWYRKTVDRGWKLAVPPQEADDEARASCTAALAGLPTDFLELIGAVSYTVAETGPSYAVDPFAVAPAPTGAWEYEAGDTRHLYPQH